MSGPPRRPHPRALPDRREPGADRAERPPRRGGHRAPRLRRRAGPLPERLEPQVRQRDLPRLELRGEGRHVHEHRAPREPRAQGGSVPRRTRARTGGSSSTWRRRSAPTGPSTRTAEDAWNEFADLVAALVGDPLRPDRGGRPPVAVHRPRPSGLAVPARAAARRARTARASSTRSSTSRRSSSPTPSTPSSSPPAGRSTTTTRRR